jgi:hypothetical protein
LNLGCQTSWGNSIKNDLGQKEPNNSENITFLPPTNQTGYFEPTRGDPPPEYFAEQNSKTNKLEFFADAQP